VTLFLGSAAARRVPDAAMFGLCDECSLHPGHNSFLFTALLIFTDGIFNQHFGDGHSRPARHILLQESSIWSALSGPAYL